jgi:hypothetical protein
MRAKDFFHLFQNLALQIPENVSELQNQSLEL